MSSNGSARMGTAHQARTDPDLQRYQQPHTTSTTAGGEHTAAHARQARRGDAGIGAPASALRRAVRCPRPAGNPAEPPQPQVAGPARLLPPDGPSRFGFTLGRA